MLKYSTIASELKDLLNLLPSRNDARIEPVIKAAVRDVIDHFGGGLGTKTVKNLRVKYVASSDYTSEQMYVVLPEDCLCPISLFVNGVLVRPVDPTQYVKIQKATVGANEPYFGCPSILETGEQIIDLWPKTSLASEYIVEMTYKSSSDQVELIPDRYKMLVLLRASYYYALWEFKMEPKVSSKFDSEYQNHLKKLNMDQIYYGKEKIRMKSGNEQAWDDTFNSLTFSRAVDLT